MLKNIRKAKKKRKKIHTFAPEIKTNIIHMNIKNIIKKHGFTQKEVAEAMGVSSSSLNNCIRLGSVSPKTLRKIAEVIGADYDEFFADEQPKKSRQKMIEVHLPENAIDGGIIELGGVKYRQVFYPLDEAKLALGV